MHSGNEIQRSSKPTVCVVSVTASHYRRAIYRLIEERLGASFIFGSGHNNIKQIEDGALKDSHYTKIHKFKGIYRYPGIAKELGSYDVVIDDMGILSISSWYNLLLSKLRRQRVYIWAHGWYGREGFLKKWLKRAYVGQTTGAFIYGNYAKDLMIQNGFNPKKLHVIHNSLDYDTQLTVRKRIAASNIYHDHFGNDNPVLIFIGRLTEVKRLDIMIDAMNILAQSDKKVNAVIVGGGDIKADLQERCKRLNLAEQVWFYGPSYNEDENGALLFNADICVAPGNIGLTAMHAMMYGCPCISHNDFPYQMPEFEAIRPGITGDFFQRDDANSLAATIASWLKEKQSDRELIRQNCYKEIDENWNPHKQIEIIESVIRKDE